MGNNNRDLAGKFMRYCIAYIAGGEIEKYYQSVTSDIFKMFGVKELSKRAPAHITLKYPFETDEAGLEIVEKRIAEIANQTTPVSFKICEFDHFDQKTIFLKVANGDVDELIKKIILALGNYDEDRMFNVEERTNHISLVRYLKPESFLKIWDHFSGLNKPKLNGVFDNISILFKENEDRWAVKKVYKFEKAKNDI